MAIGKVLIGLGEQAIDAAFHAFVIAIAIGPNLGFEVTSTVLATDFFSEEFDSDSQLPAAGRASSVKISGFGHRYFSIQPDLTIGLCKVLAKNRRLEPYENPTSWKVACQSVWQILVVQSPFVNVLKGFFAPLWVGFSVESKISGGGLGFPVHGKCESTKGYRQWCKKNFAMVKRHRSRGW